MEDMEETVIPSYPWLWRYALVAALDSFGSFVEDIASTLRASCNHTIAQRLMHEQVAREIETITEG